MKDPQTGKDATRVCLITIREEKARVHRDQIEHSTTTTVQNETDTGESSSAQEPVPLKYKAPAIHQ